MFAGPTLMSKVYFAPLNSNLISFHGPSKPPRGRSAFEHGTAVGLSAFVCKTKGRKIKQFIICTDHLHSCIAMANMA